jgi:hypothetical protein
VTACFPSLRDDDVRTGVSGSSALLGRSDRNEHDCCSVVTLTDETARVPPEERDDAYADRERRLKPLTLIPRQTQVDAEWSVREPLRLVDAGAHFVRRRPTQRQHPEGTRI